jgi:hypothetical protein
MDRLNKALDQMVDINAKAMGLKGTQTSTASQIASLERMNYANSQVAQMAMLRGDIFPLTYLQKYASGGLTRGVGIAGEKGNEWIVPTYEPERSSFLEKAPDSFWENLGGKQKTETTAPAQEQNLHVHVMIDGREVGLAVAKQIPRSSELNGAILNVCNEKTEMLDWS